MTLAFQSTRLREARHSSARGVPCQAGYFNPRACGRRDLLGNFIKTKNCISIHAPAGGATYAFTFSYCKYHNFNPRACGRRDVPTRATGTGCAYFNPRACGRRDKNKHLRSTDQPNFNPRACGRRDFACKISQSS